MPYENPWASWLEDYPSALYGAMRPRTGSRSFTDYWRGQQSNVYGDYMARLGQMTMAGQPPNLGFQEFLGQYPFLSQYLGMSPGERGQYPARYAPRLRWNV